MNTREEYAAHCLQMKVLEDKSDAISAAGNADKFKQSELIKKIVLEEGLLQQGVWIMDWLDDNDPPILFPKSSSDWIMDDESLRSLADNLQNVSFEIGSAECYLSYTEVEISFEDANEVAPFIKQHKMTVDRAQLHKRELELKKQLRSLKKYKTI